MDFDRDPVHTASPYLRTNGIKLFLFLQFYEVAWGGDRGLLERLVAEDHIQRDLVWQVHDVFFSQ